MARQNCSQDCVMVNSKSPPTGIKNRKVMYSRENPMVMLNPGITFLERDDRRSVGSAKVVINIDLQTHETPAHAGVLCVTNGINDFERCSLICRRIAHRH